MSSLSRHIPFYFVLVLALSSNLILAEGHQDFFTETCAKTETKTKELCLNILKSIPNNNEADAQDLAKFLLDKLIRYSKEISEKASLLVTKTSDLSTKRSLTDCSIDYQVAIKLFEKSLADIDSEYYDTAAESVSEARTYPMVCEDQFQLKLHRNSPLVSVRPEFDQLCDIGLALINQSTKGQPQPQRNRFIAKTCSVLPIDKGLCISILDKLPVKGKVSVKSLAKVLVQSALKDATEIHNHITVLLKKTSDKSISTALKRCSHFYKSAMVSIKGSVANFEVLYAATENAEKCEAEFMVSGKTSPLTDMNEKFRNQCAVALLLTYEFKLTQH